MTQESIQASSGDLGYVMLREERALLWIEPQGEEVQGHAQGVLPHEVLILHGRQGVIAGDEVKGIVAGLQGDVLAQRPKVVAQMGPA